jgi:ABC-2 type transport system ATP-binding protein
VASPLALRDVVKCWPSTGRTVLDDVQLGVDPGEVAAVVGPNGSGKTTLLRIAAGLIKPDAGSVRVAGLDPERERRAFHRRVGLVSAGSSALYARLTVDHHLALWSSLALLPRAEGRAASHRMIELFALEKLRGRRVDRLSMGERQRLRLALGFLHAPDLVLLDEPENSLDGDGIASLAHAIETVRARNGAVLACSPSGTHDRLYVDRQLVLADGRLVQT